MGLFGKKKKQIGDFPMLADDLPPLPALPAKVDSNRSAVKKDEFPEHRPFMPAAPINKVVLDEKSPAKRKEEELLPPLPHIKNAPEIKFKPKQKEELPELKPLKRAEDLDLKIPEQNVTFKGRVEEKKANVFVKLEKYDEVLKTIESLESRINDLDAMISRIQDIRVKERELLSKWNELLMATRNEIASITRNLPTT